MKKGFTLIELLAVIVILAIIALIATPIILGIIEDARKGSIEASANGYIDAVEYQLARDEIKGTETSSGVYDVANLDIDLDGEKPTSGYVEIEKGNVVEGSLCISGYNVVYESGKSKVNEACNKDGEVVLLPKVGDYIKMTPTLTSFTTEIEKTGYTEAQTINPSELNLWRVIKVNEDGTIEMVSEYVSSEQIIFGGQTGYKNFVGYLNLLASKYENSKYTIGSRHIGYNGQTEYLTDTSNTVDSTPPVLTLGTATSIDGNTTIPFEITDEQSGVSRSICYYGTSQSDIMANTGTITYTTNEKNKKIGVCNITGKSSTLTYFYRIYAYNGVSVPTTKDGNVATLNSTPQYGNYVQMTPTLTSFTIDKTYTGNVGNQIINPSELNLWRVIRVNSDGTIEMVSEYVSTQNICFRGQTGYKNLVGYLNVIASAYENSKYTEGSRHMGYINQTEYLTDTADTVDSTVTTAPWTLSTGPETVQGKGGGDINYSYDTSPVNNFLKTLVATTPTGSNRSYWLASRFYIYNNATYWRYAARSVLSTGYIAHAELYYYNNGFVTSSPCSAIRPILILKSGLTYKPTTGTKENPFILE